MNKPDTAASERHSEEAEGSAHKADASASAAMAPGSVIGHALISADDVEDAKFVEQSLGGDAHAFEALFLKYRQRVFTVAWRLLRDEDAALDVVQDAFVK